MKKILLSLIVIFAFVAYALFSSKSRSAVAGLPVTTTASNSTGSYKDGEYTGIAADAFYGNIQVKAVIQNGKLTDVQFIQYPNDRQESIEINSRSMPLLMQEAISVQSSSVDVVSGATDSSDAFIQSLSSALSQAKS
jgi:uncharacterized protein with FMN-binding domain